MMEHEKLQKIRRAIISVYDKTGLIEFARRLQEFDVEIISTGGTAKHLRDSGIDIRDVSELTGFPEMMEGRVKTLHPKVHGGVLARRDNPEDIAAMEANGIQPIDLVVVNLYPFEQTIRRPDVTQVEAIEQIDIGGPAMIRSAAKNHENVTVLVSNESYDSVIEEMTRHEGATSLPLRKSLALQAFELTARYDLIISAFLRIFESRNNDLRQGGGITAGTGGFAGTLYSGKDERARSIESITEPPTSAQWTLRKAADLRYGENPHQKAALYDTGAPSGIAKAEILSGKEMSYNNYVDSDAAWQLVTDFEQTTCAIIKHTNPAGVGQGLTAEEAYRRALATDPVSAFGGIVAFNCPVDGPCAKAITEIFTEVIVAPDYDPDALEILKTKKNLRVLRTGVPEIVGGLEYRQISGGILVQTRDTHKLDRSQLKVVTKRQPTEEEIDALMFAWIVCKHTKSNAIVYARDGQTVGVGAGQMSRVDSVKLGALRARLPVAGSVMASDAFFPFRDGIDEAAKYGITAVIQPGGSVKDEEVIAAADEHELAMVFTGVRHFKH
jgi:phosphoribosylaminoimidazolecarboxamide formyltransferase / IMP cyclohydrolase